MHLFGIKCLQQVQKHKIADQPSGDITNIIGDQKEPLGTLGGKSPEEDIVIEAGEELESCRNERGEKAKLGNRLFEVEKSLKREAIGKQLLPFSALGVGLARHHGTTAAKLGQKEHTKHLRSVHCDAEQGTRELFAQKGLPLGKGHEQISHEQSQKISCRYGRGVNNDKIFDLLFAKTHININKESKRAPIKGEIDKGIDQLCEQKQQNGIAPEHVAGEQQIDRRINNGKKSDASNRKNQKALFCAFDAKLVKQKVLHVAPPKKTTLLYHIPTSYVNLFDNFSSLSYTDIENSKREVHFMPYDKQTVHPFDYAALTERLQRLADTYPFLTLSYIGTSILDRAIPIIHIGSGTRRVLYVGAHHGMEWITSLVLMQFLEDLCEAIKSQKRICGVYPCDLMQGYTLSVIPMLNPDGVEYQIHGVGEENPLRERLLGMNGGSEDFSSWQANARGVDLNHNYDAGFAEYKKLEAENGIQKGAPTRYSGESAESEPEVAALCNLVRFLAPWKGVMTLHTQGEEIFSPPIKGSEKSAVTARRLAQLTGYRLARAEGLAAYGGMSDWCAEKLSVPAFTMECGRGKNPLPTTQLYSIYATVRASLFLFPTIL